MMGVWFLSLAVGNYVGGRLASFYETLPLTRLFLIVAMIPITAAVLLVLFIKPVKRLMGDVN
jgi:POT family proton-dependent oligopeptide transporter